MIIIIPSLEKDDGRSKTIEKDAGPCKNMLPSDDLMIIIIPEKPHIGVLLLPYLINLVSVYRIMGHILLSVSSCF